MWTVTTWAAGYWQWERTNLVVMGKTETEKRQYYPRGGCQITTYMVGIGQYLSASTIESC